MAWAAAGAALARQLSLRVDAPPAVTEDEVLAPFALGTASIGQASDSAALWRAVREAVLPVRVSAATGRAVLDRLWQVDAALPGMDALDIHNAPADWAPMPATGTRREVRSSAPRTRARRAAGSRADRPARPQRPRAGDRPS